MRPPPARLAAALAVAATLCPAIATAQPKKSEPPKPTVLTLRPAAAPAPALSIQLLPDRHELEPGNAAIFYHRAIEMLLQSREGRQIQLRQPLAPGERPPQSPEKLISDWGSGPLKDIPRDEASINLKVYEHALHEVELGARQATCDWNLDRRTEGFTLQIPEIQEMRSLVRLVVLRARLAVLDGKPDEAIHWLQTGFAMGRHVGQGSMLIQALVGVAISTVSARATEDLIQAPGAPNLYWAFTILPRPFVDMSMAMDGERNCVDRYLPRLRDLEAAPWSTAQAQQAINNMIRDLAPFVGSPVYQPGSRSKMSEMGPRLVLAAMVAKVYPEARRALLAAGRPVAEVDAMPASQVALIYTLREYHAIRDDMYKWTLVPYWQAVPHLNPPESHQAPIEADNPMLAVIKMIDPTVNAARLAEVRIDRQLDALRTIEAIRLHAAAHGGKLPATLAEITEVPVPIDPATGKPFEYKLEGTTATLSGPIPAKAPDHPAYALRYELRMETPR